MAGAGGLSSGPTPWWQLPNNNVPNLQASAPPGYEYDPVKQGYSRTPTSAGQRTAQFTSAALGGIPSLSGLAGGTATAGATGTSGAFGTGAPAAGTGSGGPVTPGSGVAPIQMPDMTSANASTFAAAKDKVGQISRSSLDSLAGELGSQGMLGGGAQVQGTRDIVANGAGQLGQVARDQATTNAGQALDVAKTNYGGALTQRGQDIQSQEANASLAIQRQNQQYQMLDLILKGLSGSSAAAGNAGLY